MPPSDADDNFETHQWKSEFASNRSGRNSPNIFAKVRRKLLLTPPVRNARSPRLTEEELDALTGDLPYATNYTYAYSKIYDPSLPDHWEVPNLGGGPSAGYLAEQEHWSAASLARQLLYVIRFPLFLVLHVITYILEAFYHVIKISTFTIWDYILYLIRVARLRYEAWQDHRRRTALIRNRQDPFKVKVANFFSRFLEILSLVILFPLRLFSSSKTGVEQYEYKSIKDQIENDRASRMLTRSQTLERNRRFEGLSQSPSRRTPANKTSVRTTITAKVFASGTPKTPRTTTTTSVASSSNAFASAAPVDNTPEASTARGIRGRSVTPRFRATTRTTRQRVMETPEVEVDTPLSTYGLRSRNMSHVNTPEPTFDIGHAAATSTPLFPNNYEAHHTSGVFDRIQGTVQSSNVTNTLLTVLKFIGYVILFPFIASRYIIYTFYDYGKSAYMKYTNFQPEEMEPIYARQDDDEPNPNSDDEALVVFPWTTWVGQNISSAVTTVKESFLGLFTLLLSGAQGVGSFIAGLFSGIGEKGSNLIGIPVSKRFNWCNILGLLLAILLAIFLFGFLTSDNTAIRAKELHVKQNVTKTEENALPVVPFYVTAGKHVSHYSWMVKEYVVDIAFNVYTGAKPLFAGLSAGPKYAWGVVGNAGSTVLNYIVAIPSTAAKNTRYYFNAFFALFPSSSKTITEPIQNGFSLVFDGIGVVWNTLTGFIYTGFSAIYHGIGAVWKILTDVVYNVFSTVYNGIGYVGRSFANFFSNGFSAVSNGVGSVWDALVGYANSGCSGVYNLLVGTRKSLIGLIYSFGQAISDGYYKLIYNPIASFWSYLTGNYKENLKSFKEGAWIFLEKLFLLLCRIYSTVMWTVTWPLGMFAKFWIHISQYAPEDIIQTMPLPQAITPTPVEVLPKAVEVEDEELTIRPAPAPQPIPIPNQQPVVIHQTNVVETVDKEAIIKEVTEKLRAELSAQFHDELSVKFEQNYNALIEKLKVENTNVQIDNSHLEALVRQMIYDYDADKTGQVDYALESSGGAVISTRCSETHRSYTRLEKIWNIPLYYHDYSPRIVIQRNSKSLFPGECWCFKGNHGYIAIELSNFIDVSSVSYEHIPQEIAPQGSRASAPKHFLVWAYKQIDDFNSRVLIGEYTYDLSSPPLQFFIAKNKPDFPVKFVEFEVTSNYGTPFTCLYRLRVHGNIVKV